MEHFPSVRSFEESLANYSAILQHFATYGWGLWATEVINVAPFIGFIGLNTVEFDAPFTPAVEIGWRLNVDHWGKGYATEGALATLAYAFTTAKLDELVAFTATTNMRSQAVMKKIGMHHDPNGDFTLPHHAADLKHCHQVLYRLNRNEWQNTFTLN